jgi:hypothetical protein
MPTQCILRFSSFKAQYWYFPRSCTYTDNRFGPNVFNSFFGGYLYRGHKILRSTFLSQMNFILLNFRRFYLSIQATEHFGKNRSGFIAVMLLANLILIPVLVKMLIDLNICFEFWVYENSVQILKHANLFRHTSWCTLLTGEAREKLKILEQGLESTYKG